MLDLHVLGISLAFILSQDQTPIFGKIFMEAPQMRVASNLAKVRTRSGFIVILILFLYFSKSEIESLY